jgi:UDP-glucose 4-epimerase
VNILVTGSAGFLGNWLVQDLQINGHHVIGLDQQEEFISNEFIHHDLKWPIENANYQFDICIHLASWVGGFLFNASQTSLIESEVLLLKNLKNFCDRSNCKRIIFTSSVNVFENSGVQEEGPLQIHDQKTPYAIGKARCEEFIATTFEEFTIIRPTNFFGDAQPRLRKSFGESHVIPDLLFKIKEKEIIEVFGNGEQVRNFMHIADVSDLILRLLNATSISYIHLRSNLFLTIRELAEDLKNFSNSSKKIHYMPQYLKYEPDQITRFSIATAESLEWRPKIQSLQEGLRLSRATIKNPERARIAEKITLQRELVSAF